MTNASRCADDREGPAVSTVLFVCTANQCRSPMAEALFDAGFRAQPTLARGWHAGSAGVAVPQPGPMHPLALRTLAARDAAPEHWQSRQLSAELIDVADLVLTATRAHRSAVVALAPRAVRRTFLLEQFARLLDAAPHDGEATDAAGLIDLATLARRNVQPSLGDQDDLADPVRGGAADFERCATAIDAALRPVLDRILGR